MDDILRDPTRQERSRYWCFTFNNPEWTPDTTFQEAYQEGKLEYAVFQGEIGEAGTYHFQGFIALRRAQRLSYVQKFIRACHWAIAFKPNAAEAYCRKDDTRVDGPYSIGSWNPETHGRSGLRTDLLALRDAAKGGRTLKDIIEDDKLYTTLARHPKILDKLFEIYEPQRTATTELHLVFGPPGTGKTTYVLASCPDAYWKQAGTGWWDGYRGQPDVVIEEFKGWMPFHWILRLADKPPLMVEVKGGQRHFIARRLWITSNFLPADWWKLEDQGRLDAIYRRITKVYYFHALGQHRDYDSWTAFWEAESKNLVEPKMPYVF